MKESYVQSAYKFEIGSINRICHRDVMVIVILIAATATCK